jgi:hypothetical protein
LELIVVSHGENPGKPYEVDTELTENGINDANIKKDFGIIQILKSLKSLILLAKQLHRRLKPHCKRLQAMEKIILKKYIFPESWKIFVHITFLHVINLVMQPIRLIYKIHSTSIG